MEGAHRPDKRSFVVYGKRRQSAPQPPVAIEQKPAVPDVAVQANDERRIRKQRRSIWQQIRFPRWLRISITVLVCLLLLVEAGWLFRQHQLANARPKNPFTAIVLASLKFPLYYPTELPKGFHIDPHSIEEPQENVVTFAIVGPDGAKIYTSEIARPTKYNIGGYFNQLDDLKEMGYQDGTIAVGHGAGATKVANRINNTTWILSNTNADISTDQLITMMKSLTLAY